MKWRLFKNLSVKYFEEERIKDGFVFGFGDCVGSHQGFNDHFKQGRRRTDTTIMRTPLLPVPSSFYSWGIWNPSWTTTQRSLIHESIFEDTKDSLLGSLQKHVNKSSSSASSRDPIWDVVVNSMNLMQRIIETSEVGRRKGEEEVEEEEEELPLAYLVHVRKVTLGLFVRCPVAKVRIGALQLLNGALIKFPGSSKDPFDVLGIHDVLLRTLANASSSKSPTVRQQINRALGRICKSYPEVMRPRRTAVINNFKSQLTGQMGSKVKVPEMPVIEGCLEGLDELLSGIECGGPGRSIYETEESIRAFIYNDVLVKICAKPVESSARRSAMRAGLRLFANHCQEWSAYLPEDAVHWYETLREWAVSDQQGRS